MCGNELLMCGNEGARTQVLCLDLTKSLSSYSPNLQGGRNPMNMRASLGVKASSRHILPMADAGL